jgi:hypothetical protein
MKVTLVNSRLQRHCFDIDSGANIAHIKQMLFSVSLVPSGFLPELCYAKRKLTDQDSLASIGYSPEQIISLNLVRSVKNLSTEESLGQALPSASHHCLDHRPSPAALSFPAPAAPSPAPAAATLQDGSRVRIKGLQAKPEMNGRRGVVRGAFDAQSGRWTVEVAADEAGAACLGTFRPANLTLLPAVNIATEWLDELGCVCPKVVDYASQCPKGHALVPLADGGCGAAAQRVMCRICHTHAESEQAALWLVCSADGSCAGYAVCDGCICALQQAPVAAAGDDDFPSMVCVPSRTRARGMRVAFLTLLQGVAVLYLLWLRSTLGAWIGRLTVEQACQMIIKPRTSRSRGSLVSELEQHADTSQYVGKVTWFIGHTWGNAFADTLDAVLLFFEGREDAATAKVWFDVLVDGQHAIAGPSKPSSWYMTTFRSFIARIGSLLLVVDAWDNPTALRRAW